MTLGHEHSVFTHEHYREILQIGLDSGYRFVGFDEIDEWRARDDVRTCILRHDCDNDLVASAKMAEIEHDLGVVSTYCLMLTSPMYNLFAPPNLELVRRIRSLGHRFGLHFDEHRHDAAVGAVSSLVDAEAALLSECLGVPIDVVTFHQPSTDVIEGRISTTMLNSYDREHTAGFYYLSDSNTVWREGCACEVFSAGRYPRLQLLIHPEWWTETDMPIRDKWNLMFRHNFDLAQDSMLARERAYQWRQDISFDLKDE
ncbi:MAG: hypothetical protein EG823_01585 [Actinobacteria bacterium]|nr:hypothetical protein [Actinomycetota bacterium]